MNKRGLLLLLVLLMSSFAIADNCHNDNWDEECGWRGHVSGDNNNCDGNSKLPNKPGWAHDYGTGNDNYKDSCSDADTITEGYVDCTGFDSTETKSYDCDLDHPFCSEQDHYYRNSNIVESPGADACSEPDNDKYACEHVHGQSFSWRCDLDTSLCISTDYYCFGDDPWEIEDSEECTADFPNELWDLSVKLGSETDVVTIDDWVDLGSEIGQVCTKTGKTGNVLLDYTWQHHTTSIFAETYIYLDSAKNITFSLYHDDKAAFYVYEKLSGDLIYVSAEHDSLGTEEITVSFNYASWYRLEYYVFNERGPGSIKVTVDDISKIMYIDALGDVELNCNDGFDGDGDGSVDMHDLDCQQVCGETEFNSAILTLTNSPSSLTGADGCCGDDDDDYGYVDVNGTYFCNKNLTGSFVWENAQLSALGTILDITINNENKVEHLITNSQSWFVCDANSATYLSYFNETNYISTVEEFSTFLNPDPALNLGEMSCLDAVNQVFEEPYLDCESTYGNDVDSYASCCLSWADEELGSFQLGVEGSFESNCGNACYGSNGDTLGVGLCSNPLFEEFEDSQFCLGSQFSVTSGFILKDICGFDMQNCLTESLNPFATCSSQGFTNFELCTNNSPICTADLIYSGDSGSPELKCCVSNSEGVSCLDPGGSAVDLQFCEENGGTIYDVDEGFCEPESLSFGIIGNSFQQCCFGFMTPSVILWDQPPAEKFICYKESDSNNYAECCFDDSCINYGTNLLNSRGSGGRLHQLTRFDKYDDQTGLFQDFIWQWSSGEKDFIPVSASFNYVINDWTSFNILEFDIAFNLPNIFEIILVGEFNDRYNLGKLSKYLVTGTETFRWQRAIVILPEKDVTGELIDYSHIKKIGFNITYEDSLPPNIAQYVLDDPVLSRMEVLT